MMRACLLFVALLATSAQTPPGFDTYVLGLMYRAASAAPAGAATADLQKSHLAHLTQMWRDGLLLASGPIADKGELRGVLIFRGGDRAAVERQVANDPMVKAGLLQVVLKPWMAPMAIGADYKTWAEANPGTPDKMRTYQLVLMRPSPTAPPMTPAEQLAHLTYMDGMVKSGHLIIAGPVMEPGDLAGILVFDAAPAHVDQLVAADPAVASEKMAVERHPWMVAELVLPKGFKVPLP